jgi:hypothetical protein
LTNHDLFFVLGLILGCTFQAHFCISTYRSSFDPHFISVGCRLVIVPSMARCKRNINSMWSRTTNELGVSGADNEHENKKGTIPGGEAIREDREGLASGPNQGRKAYQAWYGEK